MADPVRPPLGAEVYEAIAVEQHEVHERYWALLKAMPSPGIILLHTGPHPPKQPIRLFKTLGDYACELFDIEANRYPGDPQLLSWITQLVQRTEAMVMDNVEQLEQPTMFDVMSQTRLTYHATKTQMRHAVRSALTDYAKAYPKTKATVVTLSPQIVPPKISPTDQCTLEDTRKKARESFVLPVLQEKGMSPSKWATRAGVDPSVVYDYLSGHSTPRPDSRKALAEAIDVKIADLPE
jgi:hypothetical protein